jgi:hypothetical protein
VTKYVLAVDLGGYEVGMARQDGNFLGWLTEDFRPRNQESPGMAFVRFRACMSRVVPHGGVVVYETPFGQGRGVVISHGMAAILQELAAERGCQHTTLNPASLKTFALGRAPKNRKKGDKPFDRSKGAMVRAALLRLEKMGRVDVAVDDHQADALWLLWWYQETMGVAYAEA